MNKEKVTIADLQNKKQEGRKITMMTAYDYPTACMVDEAGIDTVLVGDSLGMVMLGYDSTVPVTMEEMLHHCKAVRRGTKRPFIIGDMPFMSYQVGIEKAIELVRTPYLSRDNFWDRLLVHNRQAYIFSPGKLNFWIAIPPPDIKKPACYGPYIGFNLMQELYGTGQVPSPKYFSGRQ